MPTDITRIMSKLIDKLQAPIRNYYGTEGLSRATARHTISDDFNAALNEATDDAVRYVTGSNTVPQSVAPLVDEFRTEQADYARGFMRDLDGLSEAAALARAGSYARSIMHLASRIATDQMPPLPVYPGDSTLQCGPFCYCHLEVVPRGGGDFDVYWRLGVAEHCDDCPALAAAWNPLPIRNGVIATGDLALPARVKRREAAARAVLKAYLGGA